jgi:hypothetical protein
MVYGNCFDAEKRCDSMFRPLPLFLWMVIAASMAGCGIRNGNEARRDEERGRDESRPAGTSGREAAGRTRGVAVPVAALGVRG